MVSFYLLVVSEPGVYNFTNPGVISHNEVLGLYKQYVDPTYKWQNFTLEEQAKILVCNLLCHQTLYQLQS